MGRSRGRRHDAEDEVLRRLRDNAASLLRFARRFSLCADDAQDAYQRSMEILLRRMREEPPESPLSWLRTVIRHEAYAVREQRLQDVGREELDLERHEARDFELDPADRIERFEELEHAAEALRRLKPQEVTALVLRAEGLSYREICDRTGWTYTRCNRAVTEGRRALASRMKAIQSGAECERWLPLLSLLADGEASARDLADLRPHLRSCRGCRATLRSFYAAPRQIGELVPAGLLPLSVAASTSGGHGFGIGRQLEALAQSLSERATAGAMRMQGAIDALPATKMAAVAASTAAIAGGGAAIDQVATGAGDRAGATPPGAAVSAPRFASSTGLAPGATTNVPIATTLALRGSSPPDRGGASARSAAGPTPTAEFGFESVDRRPRPNDPERTAAAAVGAKRSAADAEGEGEGETPQRRAPAEFRPSSPPAATATATPQPAPPPPPAPTPPPANQPEFAGP